MQPLGGERCCCVQQWLWPCPWMYTWRRSGEFGLQYPVRSRRPHSSRGELVAVKIENLYSRESWQCACGHTTARTDVRRKEKEIREELESAILDAHCTLNLVTPKRLDDRKGRRERMLPAFGSWLLRKESQQLERWNAWQLAVVLAQTCAP